METTVSTTTTVDGIVTFEELLPYQNWAYVEVVRDYHKHLGNYDTNRKLTVLNETIKPYRKAKGNDRAALQYLTLAVYMGGILTNDCMRALEMVKAHREKPSTATKANTKAEKAKVEETWSAIEPDAHSKSGSESIRDQRPKDTQTDKPMSKTTKPKQQVRHLTADEVSIWLYGSVEKADEVLNDFFGFDIKKSASMSADEFVKYWKRAQELGWRNA